ncbi:MAG: SDR family oxidoreductase [Clostridiaceae bacterium]|nr:SDR family oxidoreductase [Clostridiaceae bacterium]
MKSFVLITGATSGIGLEFAKIYAKKKENLILAARREEELKKIKEELEKYQIEVKTHRADLSKPQEVKDFLGKIKDEDIKILINNAGFGDFGEFVNSDAQKIEDMINLNILALTLLTRAIGEKMAKKGGGKIINVASTASFFPGAYMSLYYATKAFVLSLSESLYVELKPKGVHVMALCPGPTNTNFASAANLGKSNLFKAFSRVKAKDVAEYGVWAAEHNKVVAVHGFGNKLLVSLGKISPRTLNRRIVAKIQKTRKY